MARITHAYVPLVGTTVLEQVMQLYVVSSCLTPKMVTDWRHSSFASDDVVGSNTSSISLILSTDVADGNDR